MGALRKLSLRPWSLLRSVTIARGPLPRSSAGLFENPVMLRARKQRNINKEIDMRISFLLAFAGVGLLPAVALERSVIRLTHTLSF